MLEKILDPRFFFEFAVLAFFAITFLQAGLDKVVDYKGNLDYFKSHFAKSPLGPTVGLMLPVLTGFELLSGALCALGVVVLPYGKPMWGYCGLCCSMLTLLMLFFGQRVAKDYAGAASLGGYFIAVLLGLRFYF